MGEFWPAELGPPGGLGEGKRSPRRFWFRVWEEGRGGRVYLLKHLHASRHKASADYEAFLVKTACIVVSLCVLL